MRPSRTPLPASPGLHGAARPIAIGYWRGPLALQNASTSDAFGGRLLKDETSICVVAAANDEAVLRRNLLASPMIATGRVPIHVEWGASSATVAYNRGLDATSEGIVIFAHQDVYFPAGWERLLFAAISRLAARDPEWALLGPSGMSLSGTLVGPVWSSSINRIVGVETRSPLPAQSFDEMVIILRRGSNLRFDSDLPGFHLYGTDIILNARMCGLQAYVFSMPLVHNDRPHERLGSDFRKAFDYMRRKWRRELPIRTPVVWISWHGLYLPWKRLHMWKSRSRRRTVAADSSRNPAQFAAACGWDRPPE